MVVTGHRPPDWHPDELSFLSRHGLLGSDTALDDLDKVKERWIHNTVREVFLAPGGFVIKRYSHHPGRKDYRKVWKREHTALRRLSGLPVPDSLGYITVSHGHGVTSVLHLRTYMQGAPMSWRSDKDLQDLAELIAAFHDQGVVTLDPQQENFIRTQDPAQPVGFIDFGRARIFRPMSLLMLINVGKELSRLSNEGGLTPPQFEAFLRHYEHAMRYSQGQWAVVQWSYRHWQRRHARKVRRKQRQAS